MPIPAPLLAAAVQSGGNLLGQGLNAIVQAKQNKAQMKWSEKMHALQRSEALSDYHMQNEYNHPSSVMARLREGGLNPNLVYGNGQAVEPSAKTNMAPVENWNPTAPRLDLGAVAESGISAYYNTQVQQAQIDNLRTQNTVLEQDKLQKAAQTLGILQTTEGAKFDLGQRQALADTVIQTAHAGLEKVRADTRYTIDENERKAAMQAPNLQIAAETILTMRLERAKTESERQEIKQRIINLKKDETLKQMDIDMRKNGIQPNDPIYWRVLSRLLGDGIDMPKILGPGPTETLLKRLEKNK